VKTPDLLDFFVTKGISLAYSDIVPSFELSSDHTPIIATTSSTVIHRHTTPRFIIIKPTGINIEKKLLIIQSYKQGLRTPKA
jgi:hypothetical protein